LLDRFLTIGNAPLIKVSGASVYPVGALVELAALDSTDESRPFGFSKPQNRAAWLFTVAYPTDTALEVCDFDTVTGVAGLATLAPLGAGEVCGGHPVSFLLRFKALAVRHLMQQ
jgi:hypothetical protein